MCFLHSLMFVKAHWIFDLHCAHCLAVSYKVLFFAAFSFFFPSFPFFNKFSSAAFPEGYAWVCGEDHY